MTIYIIDRQGAVVAGERACQRVRSTMRCAADAGRRPAVAAPTPPAAASAADETPADLRLACRTTGANVR